MWAVGLLLVASLELLPSLVVRREASKVEDVLWDRYVNAAAGNIPEQTKINIIIRR
jgi:hypothetical protein